MPSSIKIKVGGIVNTPSPQKNEYRPIWKKMENLECTTTSTLILDRKEGEKRVQIRGRAEGTGGVEIKEDYVRGEQSASNHWRGNRRKRLGNQAQETL